MVEPHTWLWRLTQNFHACKLPCQHGILIFKFSIKYFQNKFLIWLTAMLLFLRFHFLVLQDF